MSNVLTRIVRPWGTKPTFNLAGHLCVLCMFGLLAVLEANKIGLYLVPSLARRYRFFFSLTLGLHNPTL